MLVSQSKVDVEEIEKIQNSLLRGRWREIKCPAFGQVAGGHATERKYK
jgi:hypothetical protein